MDTETDMMASNQESGKHEFTHEEHASYRAHVQATGHIVAALVSRGEVRLENLDDAIKQVFRSVESCSQPKAS